jgi:tRNA (guanine9-N1)-methyltransferase
LSDDKKIVYLTSESENVLENFDHNCIYIIGGLVDHNNHKGICHRLALEKGVGHARFPIQEAGIDMKTRQVLTIDHVFRIVASVASEGKEWNEALIETLPERKGARDVTKIHSSDSENGCDEQKAPNNDS